MAVVFFFPSVFSDQVFGCSLSSLCHRENSTVPSFVKMCIDHVENNGAFRYVSLQPDLSQKETILVSFNLPVVKEGWGLRPHNNTGSVLEANKNKPKKLMSMFSSHDPLQVCVQTGCTELVGTWQSYRNYALLSITVNYCFLELLLFNIQETTTQRLL